MHYEEFKRLVRDDPKFADFRTLFEHEPLQRFVYAEKCILGELSETRIFHHGEERGGIAHSTQVVMDDCYGVFTPFQIKALWLPLSQGRSYSILDTHEYCPILRKRNGMDECLFFIHPKTETQYAELLTHHASDCLTFNAFSLSSPRSLLVALPDESGITQAVLIKVSLNQKAHGVLRLLSARECALSVANTSIFSRILRENRDIELAIFEDPFSFVPKDYDFGMSYRRLPAELNPQVICATSPTYILPLLAFYGKHNAVFFKKIIEANGHCVTDVLTTWFNPFIHSYLTLLLKHHLSIEAHGQNLLLIFDFEFKFKGLFYRDMGGVNTPIKVDDLELPPSLRQPELSFYHNHVQDAANALEHLLVWRGLYPLTKQLVKHGEHFQKTDPYFDEWYKASCDLDKTTGVLGNWTDGNSESDLHIEYLDIKAFYRYGYVETLFGYLLIQAIESQSLLDAEVLNEFKSRLFLPEQVSETLDVAPCTYLTFFDDLITKLLHLEERTFNSRSHK